MKRRRVPALTLLTTFLTIPAVADDYSQFGMHRPMTDDESFRYKQCMEIAPHQISGSVIDGKQLTVSEALGPALTNRMCACVAIRTSPDTDDFSPQWRNCAETIIGGR